MHWLYLWRIKKGVSLVYAFQNVLDSSSRRKAKSKKRKTNKIWVDQASGFSNNCQYFLKINDIEMYSTSNEGKFVITDGFIRIFKKIVFKHMTAISKNVYFDVLDDIVNKYNKKVHRTIKMKPIDVNDNTYVDSKK